MTIGDTSTPVLVLNAIHYGALGVTRSLGRLGVTVYNQSPFRSVPAFHSKYSQRNILWDQDAAGADQTTDFLLSIGRSLENRALLIPTCDVTAMLVADYDETLRTCFRFPRQPKELVHSLCSKKGMYHLAVVNGIPTPETSFPLSRSDVLRFLDSARFPVVVKTIKNRIGETVRAMKVIVRDRQHLLSVWDQLSRPGDPNVMLQEYIPGGEDSNWMFNGYFNEQSDCLIGITGRKIRQFPAYAGVTSLGVCASNDTVTKMTLRFMRALRYRGILDMGYRFDARDGQYKVYDINPRIGATFRLFVDTFGYDVVRAFYLDMTNQPVCPGQIREGRKWAVEDSDLLSSFRYHSDGQLSLRGWIRSLHGIEEGALFALDDMMPLGARMIDHLRKLVKPHRAPVKRDAPPPAAPESADHEHPEEYAPDGDSHTLKSIGQENRL